MLRPLGDHCLLDGENDCAILTVVISFSLPLRIVVRISTASVVIILFAIHTEVKREEKRGEVNDVCWTFPNERRCFACRHRQKLFVIRSGEL